MTKVVFDPLRFKLLYFFMYGGLGILAPYVPVFFERLLMSKSQIGFLLMIPSISSFIFAPVWSLFCDRLDVRSEVMFFTLIMSEILTFSMYFFDAFLSMALVVLVGSVVKAPLTSLLDSLVIDSLEDKTRYGSLRLWGAVAFALTSFIGGAIIAIFDADEVKNLRPFLYIFSLHALFGIFTGIIIFSITLRNRRNKANSIKAEFELTEIDTEKLEEENIEQTFVNAETSKTAMCAKEEGERESVSLSVWRVLTKDPSVAIFLSIVFFSGLGSGVIDAFLFLRLKQLGGSGIVMGVSRAITCIAEVPCFQVAGMLQKRLGTWRLLAVTQLAFVIRFTYYSFLKEPWAVLPCEVLHGFTFAVMWSTACTYADEIAPSHVHSTIQAIVESVHWGLGSGLGALLGGFAYSSLGPVVLFEASAIMSFLSMLLAMLGFVMYTKEQSYTSDTEPIFNAISAVPLDGDDIDNSSAADDSNLDDEEASISFNSFSCKVESRISAVASTVRVDPEGNINSYAAVGFEDSEKGID